MPSVRDLRDRLRSLKNTQQITKAMKQVAAAKIRRAELARKQARPYAETLAEMLDELIGSVSHVDHPFMKPGRSGAPAGVVLIAADKGLCGAFNSHLARMAELLHKEHPDARFYTVGTKARNAVRRFGVADHPTWLLGSPSKLGVARDVAQRVSDDFSQGTISEIVLISAKLISMLSQRPEKRRLVPIVPGDFHAAAAQPSAAGPKGSLEFVPSPQFVLSRLLPKYLEFTFFLAMLETDAAFFAAQLLAMNNATENASKLIDELTIQMNNARQAAITKELLEIVAGAEALNHT